MLASLLSLALLARATAALDFSGVGQIRTLWNDPGNSTTNGMDLGCLTDDGFWTINEAKCGTFYGNRTQENIAIIYLDTAKGPCGRNNVQFACQNGMTETQWILFYGGYVAPVPGRDVLGWGEYGLMASRGNNPPLLVDAPEPIYFWGDTDTGKFVWMGWKAL